MNKTLYIKSILPRLKRTFIGDKKFYKTVLALVIPIIIQNSITNFVNLLDNIMIGQVGTAQMSGVAIANQLMFVFYLAVFGGLAGAGIFAAQFFGAGDNEGLRYTLRYKLWASAVILAVALAVFLSGGDWLISLFLKGEGDPSEAAAILEYGRVYLRIMLWGLLPFILSQVYGSTLREIGDTMVPMVASVAAVLTNLCFNWVLIFGKLGFPEMGVAGAAIATVISRYVELVIIAVYTHMNTARFGFVAGVYRSMRVPRGLALTIFNKGMPLLANEVLWAVGVSALTQIFSTYNLNVVGALNIANTITNLFNVAFISMGSAVAVMVGQALGAGDMQRAKEYSWKLIFFSVCTCIIIGAVLVAVAPVIPRIYNTTEDVRKLSAHFMIVSAFYMPFFAISHCAYFTIRSGGKTFITLVFDSAYTWGVIVPVAYLIAKYADFDIYTAYPVCYFPDVLKSVLGLYIIKKGRWAQNIVANGTESEGVRCFG
ncbi:MAG TPA: MATE family efflux transporter [Hungateiclostridium thermocellum]|jgi:putative MATE family efflux protein|uniref:Probable multidrug resistance protein NorM n=2 Tax=Acetivibrio thermocellus TaxID=1515 RepID=A3DDE9_ACET2|nr:MATE family efflux transporter [Acetivibrio thermocellus]CDG35438.1 MATE efflux family protein [Acetivibrio thermocellus BC1]ABN51978.1 MATE efflux family protein [Acetivibrio thermocellus ATCC 27405]ADU74541.1 MATE efflux family protein [Acetivibrio thermocellus DSM 1313]ALX08484.1 MATE efflux family protein [Acetivibrio thermocellus AD2]ANV76233.1 MATE efflux family protein [Acetivibrio thermocellus DSM 2360]